MATKKDLLCTVSEGFVSVSSPFQSYWSQLWGCQENPSHISLFWMGLRRMRTFSGLFMKKILLYGFMVSHKKSCSHRGNSNVFIQCQNNKMLWSHRSYEAYIHSMNCIYMHVKQCTGNIQWWDDCQRHMKSKLRHGVIWIYGWIVYIFHYCDSEDLFVGRQSFPLLEGTVPFLKFSSFFVRCDFAFLTSKFCANTFFGSLIGLLVAFAMKAFSLWTYQQIFLESTEPVKPDLS